MPLPIDQHLLAVLMETIPDRIYFKDREGRFLAISRAFLDFLKLPDFREIEGKTDFDIFLPEHAQDARADEQYVMSSGNPIVGKIEKEILPDGRVHWVSTTKAPMRDSQGEIIGTCGISRDITADYYREEKLKEYSAALAQQQQEAEQEMKLAREIQSALVQETFPVFTGKNNSRESQLAFAHRYLPAGAVGGDFFSVQKLSETKVGIFISDVMGHGVHAALVTAILRVLIEELYPLAHQPGKFLQALNGRLFQILKRVENCMFVTASYLVLDIECRSVLLANASHPAPFLIHRESGTVERLGPARRNNSFSLGLLEDSAYEVSEQSIRPGSTLLFYTDGLSDIYGPDGKECREMDLQQIVKDLCSLQGEQLVDGIISRVREKAEAVTFQDDVCLISVDWKNLNS